MRKILGRTEAFNQLVFSVNQAREIYGITRTKVNKYTLRYYGTSTDTTNFTGTTGIGIIAGHKYLVLATGIPSACSIRFFSATGIAGVSSLIVDVTSTGMQSIGIIIPSGTTVDANIAFACVDLTIEGLGLTTVDQFNALHPLPYYNYNAGVLKNNAATGLETTGFNQYNPTTGTAQVIAGKTYYIGGSYTSISQDGETITPENHLFTPTNTGEVVVVGGNDTDTIINISDASRNGDYEPYWKRDIMLGLNNLACHDEDNNAVVVNGLDGVGTSQDELIVENGLGTKIIKRRGRRAYQAGDESDATLMTDGTNTDYPLATPKVLTLDNPIPALIEVDNLGTEKRLPEDTADNPQAPFECDSNYSVSTANLVRLLNL